jgi:hypothetical protein
MTKSLLPAVIALAALASACGKGDEGAAPPVPASSDPEGNDLVVGAVIAAAEPSGGYRLNKLVFVEAYPPPLSPELHLIAYNPKGSTYEEAARIWRKKESLSIALDHIEVRKIDFMKRDHRVLLVEPVTDAEKAPYLRSIESRRRR